MTLPIITYHRIIERHSSNREKHSVFINEFRVQMAYIKDAQLEVVRLEDFLIKNETCPDIGRQSVALSFDDGHDSDYQYVFGILKELELTATFFTTTGWIGQQGYMSWENLREMSEAGMSIQSHGVSHSSLPNLDDRSLRDELFDSKKSLEERLEKSVTLISAPHGFFSNRVVAMAKTCGYKGFCTSIPGINANLGSNIAIFDRLMVTRKTSFERFKKLVSGDSALVRRDRRVHELKSVLRRVVGNGAYNKVWSFSSREI